MFLSTARTKVNEIEQLQTQRQAQGQQQAGITGTLGGIFNDAKAVATGRRDGAVSPAQGQYGQGQQGQGLAALQAGVGSALSGLSGLFGARNANQQGEQAGQGSSWGSGVGSRSMGGGASNVRSGGMQGQQAYSSGGRRWQPTDIYGESRSSR